MTEKDGSSTLPSGYDGERKLSIPNSVQRRMYGSGTENRVVVIAVDPSECAKSAFMCTSSTFCLNPHWINSGLIRK